MRDVTVHVGSRSRSGHLAPMTLDSSANIVPEHAKTAHDMHFRSATPDFSPSRAQHIFAQLSNLKIHSFYHGCITT